MASHTVLSTGTWMIGFNRGRPLEGFIEARAMVANVDVDGEPIASTLTMTGREYAILAGDKPVSDPAAQSILDYGRKAISEGMTPAAVASMVLDAVQEDQFWVFPHQDFLDIAIARWDRIGERINPEPPKQLPGMPPRAQMIAELMRAMEQAAKKG